MANADYTARSEQLNTIGNILTVINCNRVAVST